MRWLSLTSEYAHQEVGGTQIYVHRLNLALRRRHIEAIGAYFTKRSGPASYEGIPLIALPVPPRPETRLASWECPPHGTDDFERLLDEVRPDVVHFNSTLNLHPPEFFEIARRSGARTLWTYHAPGQTCLQTALLREGRVPCDGRIEPGRCARCGLVWSGLPSPVATLFGSIDLSALAPLMPRSLTHPFERRHGLSRFLARLERACASLDHWVTHARWTRELLQLNNLGGLPPLELPLPAPGVGRYTPDASPWEGLDDKLRLLYAGRFLDIKGPDLLLRTLSEKLRGEEASLALMGPLHGIPFEAEVKNLVAREHRARLLPPRDTQGMLGAMAAADAVVVPSLWLETGPYTVLEAQWVGAPVIGANVGGIGERLADWPASVLFQRGDPEDLARAVRSLRGRREDENVRSERAEAFQSSYVEHFETALDRVLDAVR